MCTVHISSFWFSLKIESDICLETLGFWQSLRLLRWVLSSKNRKCNACQDFYIKILFHHSSFFLILHYSFFQKSFLFHFLINPSKTKLCSACLLFNILLNSRQSTILTLAWYFRREYYSRIRHHAYNTKQSSHRTRFQH